MLIGLSALAGGLQTLAPAPAAAMDDTGGYQCQTLGDMYLNEITGQYEFCLFDGSGGSGGAGGPFYVGSGGGSGTTTATPPIPGTGFPGETIQVTSTAPGRKCGDLRVICVNLGISVMPDSSTDEDRDRRRNPPRGGGGRRGAEVPKKKAAPKKEPAGQDTEPSAQKVEEERIAICQIWRQQREWWRERQREIPQGRYFSRPLREDQVAAARRQALRELAVSAEKLKKDKCG
jgi:hypothetical protein